MNGTTLRMAAAVACVAALAAPSAALAKKQHTHKAAKQNTIIVAVPHTYDAGGNGIELTTPAAGQRINLFDAVNVAVDLGNNVLGQLGVKLPTV